MKAALLRPRTTSTRRVTQLDGLWTVALGTDDSEDWRGGVPGTRVAAVPGSINEQLTGAGDHIGPIWYERTIEVGPARAGARQVLRFDAATLTAVVWLDGEEVGRHEGGFLPFACDITDHVEVGAVHRLTVRVEHGSSLTRTPVGGKPGTTVFGGHPATSYDFFPFGGLTRSVRLLELPPSAIEDLVVRGRMEGDEALIEVVVEASGGGEVVLEVEGTDVTATVPLEGGFARASLRLSAPRLWNVGDPKLYQLRARLVKDGHVVDAYHRSFGIRTIEVRGSRLLLNGQDVFLKGFGKHEDFPIYGRGLAPPVIVRDAELLEWVGANSYRTSHYPYAEEALELADERGILVISETSAVGLNFYDDVENVPERLRYVRAELDALIRRDRNHPSVVAWSVANEPFAKPIFQPTPATGEAVRMGREFLQTLIDDAHALDPSRPAMVVGAQGHPDDYIAVGDILGINRYYGWYTHSGRVAEGAAQFGAELDALARFDKPVLVCEFGTDTLPGAHSVEAEMWTEEYQAEFIEAYLDEIAARPHVAGAHVWNFADFKTSQSILRAGGLNHKGVFTRDRRPKMAAHLLRRRWRA